jgi:hypothetical protein
MVVEFVFVGDGDPSVAVGFSVPEFTVDTYEDALFGGCPCIEDEDVWIRIRPAASNPLK